MFSNQHNMKTNSRFDQGLRRLFCGLAAGAMTLGLTGPSVLAQTPIQLHEEVKLTAGDAPAARFFGSSVSASGGVAVVGAWDDSGARGALYVYRFDGITWNQEAKLRASDAEFLTRLGWSVSVSGDVIVAGTLARAAYIFVKPPGGWVDMTQTAKLTPSGPAVVEGFGAFVSVSGDVVVVGAPRDDDADQDAGSAYIFVKPLGGWVDMTETAKLTASDPARLQNLGNSVSVSGDVAVVGTRFVAGAAYVFVKPSAGWGNMTETAQLTASDGAAGDAFGTSVSVMGNLAFVGARGRDAPEGFDFGAAYVFVKPSGGWVSMTETAKLTASDAAAGDLFGNSVSVSGDVAVVGAPGDDDGGPNRGSAYLYRFNGSTWVEEAKLTVSEGSSSKFFGGRLDLADGDIAVVGMRLGDNTFGPAESAYVFNLVNQPPVITCNGPVVLWSPDHELVDVSSAISVDDPDGDPVTLTFRVFSDETEIPDTGDGTGRHAPDFKDEFLEGRGLLVRSERRSAEDGRFYIFVITADDGNGGVTTAVCAAAVCPHDQNQPSLDDVLAQAAAAAVVVQTAVDSNTFPPTEMHEHGLSDPLGPKQ